MNKFFTTMLALAALAVAVPATLAAGCEPTTSEPEVTQGEYYVDNDACQPECIFSIWVYQESNGIAGLQRSDEQVDNTCGGAIESDTIIV